jgi:CheY-like chemotaxis protein
LSAKGFNVTELGRSLQQTSPPDGNETLIAVTDDSSKEREKACMEPGFAEVIRKPIRMEGLRQLILRHTT